MYLRNHSQLTITAESFLNSASRYRVDRVKPTSVKHWQKSRWILIINVKFNSIISKNNCHSLSICIFMGQSINENVNMHKKCSCKAARNFLELEILSNLRQRFIINLGLYFVFGPVKCWINSTILYRSA